MFPSLFQVTSELRVPHSSSPPLLIFIAYLLMQCSLRVTHAMQLARVTRAACELLTQHVQLLMQHVKLFHLPSYKFEYECGL